MSGQENLFQSLSLTLYLAGLGIGSLLPNRENFSITKIVFLEFGNYLVGALTLPLLFTHLSYFTATKITAAISPQDIPLAPLFLYALGGILLLGIFTGGQLPEFLKRHNQSKNVILFMNYFGALLAGIFLNHLMAISFSAKQILFTFLLLSSFNLILCIPFIKRKILSLILLPPFLGIFLLPGLLEKSKSIFLASYYQGLKVASFKDLTKIEEISNKLGSIESYNSPYQEIHLLLERPVRDGAALGNISLYLNYRPQFDIYSTPTYHQSMLYGPLNLSQKSPENILILGGGDGILLKEIYKALPKSKVTLVELDPLMIELFSSSPLLTHFNGGVLIEKPESIIIEDGLHFLKTTEKKYDAIFIDFPYPYSDELTSLYSLEFYRIVKSRLKKNAFFVVDFPVLDRGEDASPLYSKLKKTLEVSGLKTVFPFGPYSSFVFVEEEFRELDFNYESIRDNLHMSTYLNLVGLKHLKTEKKVLPFSLFYEN